VRYHTDRNNNNNRRIDENQQQRSDCEFSSVDDYNVKLFDKREPARCHEQQQKEQRGGGLFKNIISRCYRGSRESRRQSKYKTIHAAVAVDGVHNENNDPEPFSISSRRN
jgi:hypothetical protein